MGLNDNETYSAGVILPVPLAPHIIIIIIENRIAFFVFFFLRTYTIDVIMHPWVTQAVLGYYRHVGNGLRIPD